MNLLQLTGSILLLGASAMAQTLYSPHAAYRLAEGGSRAHLFGTWPDFRCQMADGSLRTRVATITRISYRPDYAKYLPAPTRSWSKVTLALSDTNLAKLTNSFSNNPTSTPSTVYAGALSFPSPPGYPATKPAAFSIQVPFRTPWLYRGTADLLADYRFSGGTMANIPWTIYLPRIYFLDSYAVGTHRETHGESNLI